MEMIIMFLGSAILLLIPLILFVFLVIGIILFVILMNNKGRNVKNNQLDDMHHRMHQNFMDDSRRAHEMHMNMHNNMFH